MKLFIQKFFNVLLIILLTGIGFFITPSYSPVLAEGVDPYVRRYLASEPVDLPADNQGQTQQFTPEDLTTGKTLFEASCLNCHAGGVTIPYPAVSLSLEDLKAATPARDNIKELVNYFRYPISFDGSDTNYWCREIPETWLPQAEAEKLAAYIIRSGEVIPSWGKMRDANELPPEFRGI
ncbi:MAG: photosystem II cytochrome PsbV2 [Cyanobacteriota bacterium]|nr:photosystem II cytochrome PsbV2 [Cyanobacteriota bacterium]